MPRYFLLIPAKIKFTKGIKNNHLLKPASFNLLKPILIKGKTITNLKIVFSSSKLNMADIIPNITLNKKENKKKNQNSFIVDLPLKSKIFLKGSIKYFILL
jgi:hypothetical protein